MSKQGLPKKVVVRGEERFKLIFDQRLKGATNKEIAEMIGITEGSLSDQVRRNNYREYEKKHLQDLTTKLDSSLELDLLQALKRHLAVPQPDPRVMQLAAEISGKINRTKGSGSTTNVLSIGDAETYNSVKKRIDGYVERFKVIDGDLKETKNG